MKDHTWAGITSDTKKNQKMVFRACKGDCAEVPGLLMAERNKAFKLDNIIMTNLIVNLLFVTWSLAITDTQRTSEHCTASGHIY